MTNHLTRRQREVLQLLTDGKSNKEIARALGIAEAPLSQRPLRRASRCTKG